jgi:hypothetical protein
MELLEVAIVFGLFFGGLVLAFQGFVGKEINPDGTPFAMPLDLDNPGVEHPPERHRLRLFLSGLGLMVLAVAVGVVLL